ncbi:hypothetical protein [Alloactinosynnema sp. L-07]|uniref:hypothetical protein n=1 Tax=Alloactinosynnema sp. L-07 TaxID=1653480 RepID=UPI00065EFA2F|nr:hypothetical protein [Alloactinosynnema sp. L-07]CRK56811.1 hypothetical protein [Alloactinosynnema sp. L-07]
MAIREWWLDRRTEGIVRTLAKNPDPAATVDRLAPMIDDKVIEALLTASERAESPHDAMTWADVAVRASLLGGTAVGRADALMHRAATVLGMDDTWKRGRLLARAEEDALGAVEILREHGTASDLVASLCLLARVHTRQGDGVAMVGRMAQCFHATDDDADLRTRVSRLFTDLYWDLSKSAARESAAIVIPELNTVLAAADDPALRAEVLDALGRAYSFLDADYDKAVDAWERSADLYRRLGRARDEFLIRARVQWHAVVIDNDRSIREGLACLACAPAETAPTDLATVHHVLATAYRYEERVDDALAAYARAVELLSHDPKNIVHDLVFEAATLMAEDGRYNDARAQFEAAMAGPGGAHVWWATQTELAELLSTQIIDLGAAIRHAEHALTDAVTLNSSDPMYRIISLHRVAQLQLSAGNIATAHQRFQLLVPLLTQPTRAIEISVSKLFNHSVVPLSRSEILWHASIAARAAGDNTEADAWAGRSAELRGTDPSPIALDDDVLDDPETLALAVETRELTMAMSLAAHSPDDALARLATPSLTILAGSNTRARVDMTTGVCLEKLGDQDGALAAFERALNGHLGPMLDQLCHWRIATIHHSRQEYGLAYPHLVTCVQMADATRTTFDDIEARMAFMSTGLARYERLIEVCLLLGRVGEALAVVQQVKSRALLDMLAQPHHRPIDFRFEARAAALRAEQDRWLAEFAAGTGPEGPAEDYPTSPQHRMLADIVANTKDAEAFERERRERELFDRLTDEGTPLDFAAIRGLLAGWNIP